MLDDRVASDVHVAGHQAASGSVAAVAARVKGWPIALALITLAYLHNTLPYLTALPRVNVDEPWLLERAYHVMLSGLPKQPMYSLDRAYLLQPGYSYVLAPWLKVFGMGILQARLLSVLMALAVVLMIFEIGRMLIGIPAGLVAASFLASDSNFLGGARFTRTDTPALFFVTLSLYLFYLGVRRNKASAAFFSGLACGLAMLCHANSYWVVPIIAASYFIVYGWNTFTNSSAYLWVAGAAASFGPYVIVLVTYWREFQWQLGHFASDRVPGISLRTIAYHVGQEPQRYRDWYFGLITDFTPNPLLRTFQACIVIGAVTLAARVVGRSGGSAGKRKSRLAAVLAFGSVVIFAGFIPNKALVYMPNLLLGFSLLAGLGVVAAAERVRMGWLRPGQLLALWLIVFNVGAVFFYASWYARMRNSPYVAYEQTAKIVKALVPEGRKYLFGSPTYWLPFHDDPGVRFISLGEMGPFLKEPATLGRNSLYDLPDDRDTFVLVDDAEFGLALANQEGDRVWRTNWLRYLTKECSPRAIALNTAHGDFVSYQCWRDRPPQKLELWVADRRGRYRLSDPIWSADADAIDEWQRWGSATRVTREGDGVHVSADSGGGLFTVIAVPSPGKYVLDVTAEDRTGSGIVSVKTITRSGVFDSHWFPLGAHDWLPLRHVRFDAAESAVRIYLYADARADFLLRSVTVRPLAAIAGDRATP